MKKVYTIEGLDCANCAAKLERKMNEHPLVEEAVITFATQQLRITAENPDSLLGELQQIADKMEDGITIRKRVRSKKSTGDNRHHHKEHCGCEGDHHEHHHGEHCGCEGDHHEHHHGEHCGCEEHHHEHHHKEHCGCEGHHHEHHHKEHCGCEGEHHEHHHKEHCGCEGNHHEHHHKEHCGCEGNHHEHHHGEHCGCEEHHHEHHHKEHCECEGHDHEHLHNDKEHQMQKKVFTDTQKKVIQLGVGIAAFTGAIVCEYALQQEICAIVFFLLAYLFLGGEIVRKALKNIVKGNVFDENFLMSLATIGAFIIGEYAEAVGVMLFYQIGELFEEVAVNKSRKQIMDAVDMRAETVNVRVKDAVVVMETEKVKVGDRIVVRPGDRIPLDGTVIYGESRVDTSPITGEPVPVKVEPGSEVVSGCINEYGIIEIQVEKELEESMVTRILDSVENAAASKPKIDRFITRFARVYTPFVVILALLTAIIPSLITGNWEHWIYTALTFLVISCPCALVLSVPLAFFAGIGAGSKQGILIKGGASLEAMEKIKVVAMDKTGTITEGNFAVQKMGVAKGIEEHSMLLRVAICEKHSSHPIAMSIMDAVKIKMHKDPCEDFVMPERLEEIAGKGIKANVYNDDVLCGNRSLMEMEGIDLQEYEEMIKNQHMEGSEVLVAINHKFAGYFWIADTVKKDSKETIAKMNQRGLVTAMLTGDTEESARYVAKETGVSKVFAKLLPEDKCSCLTQLREQYGGVMYIGDGINDAPVLAGADVGAAMGAGAEAAMEAADVVFMNSSLTAIIEAIRIAKRALRVSKQNVIFALGIKAIVMILGLCGMASMWMAVFADSGVAMLCVLNSVKILYDNRK